MRRSLSKLRLLMTVAAALGSVMLPAGAPARSVYVPNEGTPPPGGDFHDRSLSVIDSATDKVSATITTGLGLAANTVAITPDGGRAYVTNIVSDSVSVIDTATNAVTRTIPLAAGARPWLIAIAPDGSRAYVANHGAHDNPTIDSVSVIDTAKNATVGAPIPVGADPVGIAITPDGARAYVANWGSSTVSVIDVASRSVSTIPLGSAGDPNRCDDAGDRCPIGIAIAPNGSQAYVANVVPDTVSVIATASNTVGNEIQLPDCSDPGLLAITPDGSRVYVANTGRTDPPCNHQGSVSVIDTSTNTTVGGPIPEETHPDGIAITPDGSRVYVSNFSSDDVYALSTVTNSLVAGPIAVGVGPQTVAITPDQGPTANFTQRTGAATAAGSSSAGASNATVATFDATASSDPDGTVARYDWDFGDGSRLENGGPTPSHTYPGEGTYTVTLTVTDNEGASTARTFTGQTVQRNGSAAARKSASVTIDTTAPKARVAKPRKNKRYRRRSFRKMFGTATDISGVSKVEYALGSRRRKAAARARPSRARRCRFLTRKGTLGGKARSCRKPTYLAANGTTSWSAKLRRILPRGRYTLHVRATDTRGNLSQPATVPFSLA